MSQACPFSNLGLGSKIQCRSQLFQVSFWLMSFRIDLLDLFSGRCLSVIRSFFKSVPPQTLSVHLAGCQRLGSCSNDYLFELSAQLLCLKAAFFSCKAYGRTVASGNGTSMFKTSGIVPKTSQAVALAEHCCISRSKSSGRRLQLAKSHYILKQTLFRNT